MGDWVDMPEYQTRYRITADRNFNGDVTAVTARISDVTNDELSISASRLSLTFRTYDTRPIIFHWEVMAAVMKEIQSALGVPDAGGGGP